MRPFWPSESLIGPRKVFAPTRVRRMVPVVLMNIAQEARNDQVPERSGPGAAAGGAGAGAGRAGVVQTRLGAARTAASPASVPRLSVPRPDPVSDRKAPKAARVRGPTTPSGRPASQPAPFRAAWVSRMTAAVVRSGGGAAGGGDEGMATGSPRSRRRVSA